MNFSRFRPATHILSEVSLVNIIHLNYFISFLGHFSSISTKIVPFYRVSFVVQIFLCHNYPVPVL